MGDAAGYTYISFDDDVQCDVRNLARISALDALPRLMSGVVLYDGDSLVSFDEKLFAVRICLLWEM